MSRLNCQWCNGIAQQNKRRQGPIKGVGHGKKWLIASRETGRVPFLNC